MNFCLANLRENFNAAIGLNYLLTVRTNTQMLRLEQQDETRRGGGGSKAKYMQVQEQKHFCRPRLNFDAKSCASSGLRKIFFLFQIWQFQKSFERVFFSSHTTTPSQSMITTIVRGNFLQIHGDIYNFQWLNWSVIQHHRWFLDSTCVNTVVVMDEIYCHQWGGT